MSFSDVVETIKNLSLEEKQELQALIAQYLREERRQRYIAVQSYVRTSFFDCS